MDFSSHSRFFGGILICMLKLSKTELLVYSAKRLDKYWMRTDSYASNASNALKIEKVFFFFFGFLLAPSLYFLIRNNFVPQGRGKAGKVPSAGFQSV